MKRILQRMGNPLDWTEVSRGVLLMVLISLLFSQIMLWGWYARHDPELQQLTVPGSLDYSLPIGISFTGTAILLGLLGYWTRNTRLTTLLFPHVSAQFYAISMCFFGYISGSFSFAAGVVMAGAPIVGFIIFRPRVIYPAYLTAGAIIFGTTWLSALGKLTYGPIFRNNVPTGDGGLFWFKSMVFFSSTQLLTLVWLADMVIRRWKQRELEVKTLSLVDALTGISNRRHITQYLEQEVARARRHTLPLSLVLIDIDHFKRINDTFGHPAGDQVLQTAAATLADVVRQSDAVGRYGGEEFMLVLAADAAGARILAERCRQSLEDLEIVLPGGKVINVTASFGICALHPGLADAEAMIRLADGALYQAKDHGRNRVEMAASPIVLH